MEYVEPHQVKNPFHKFLLPQECGEIKKMEMQSELPWKCSSLHLSRGKNA